jgi:hypothetical protein
MHFSFELAILKDGAVCSETTKISGLYCFSIDAGQGAHDTVRLPCPLKPLVEIEV